MWWPRGWSLVLGLVSAGTKLAKVCSVGQAWKERSAHIKLQQDSLDSNSHMLLYPCPITVVPCRQGYKKQHLPDDRVTWTSCTVQQLPHELRAATPVARHVQSLTGPGFPLGYSQTFVRNSVPSTLMQSCLGSDKAMLATEIRNEASKAARMFEHA